MASDTEITKVRIVIRHLLWQIREIRNDRDAAWKWVNRFANTLQYQELEQDPDQYALAILAEARSFNDQQRRKGQMLGVRKQLAKEGVTNPTQEQLDEKWLEMYGNEFTQDAPNGNAGVDMSDARNGAASKSPTSCDIYEQAGNLPTRESETRGPQTDNNSEAVKALADGDIREDSHDGKSGTSANNYGDAATREGADVSTTVSRNMRRVPQNEAPAHGFSGGRTAQGTMSRSPEAAAQSGKDYDQVPYLVSTDEARQGQALVNQTRAGAAPLDHAPVRNLPRNKEEVRLFAIDNGLDVDDANDWAEMNLRERHGRDKDGKPIRNWKGAIRNYCKAMAAKRETA